MRSYWTYIRASRPHGTLYVGVTNGLIHRIDQHRAGKGSAFTRRYSVHTLVWFEEFASARDAIQREKKLAQELPRIALRRPRPPACPAPRSARAQKIIRRQARPLGNPCQHDWPKFLVVVKGEHHVRPAVARQRAMRPGLPLDNSSDAQQRRQHAPRLGRRKPAHSAATDMDRSTARASPCSSCSASTRSASACAFAIASSRVAP